MFAVRPALQKTRETVWLAIIAILAGAILLTLNVKLAGGAEPSPPRFLPALVAEWQEAVNQFRDGNFALAHVRIQEVRRRVAPGSNVLPHDRGIAVWSALAAQAHGKLEQAARDWRRIELPDEMRAWKHIALAALYLETGRNNEAGEELAMAQLLDPANALVHYYLGILHIQRADEAIDWPDYVDTSVRLAAHNPTITPNTKGMYQLAATMELESAIEAAPCVDGELSLIPDAWLTEPALRPLLADLLQAIRATNFEANSHHMLGYLYLERDDANVAEGHLDRANDLGTRVPYVYDEIGKLYDAKGQHADAARAYLKAARNGPDRVGAIMRFFQSAGDSIRDDL